MRNWQLSPHKLRVTRLGSNSNEVLFCFVNLYLCVSTLLERGSTAEMARLQSSRGEMSQGRAGGGEMRTSIHAASVLLCLCGGFFVCSVCAVPVSCLLGAAKLWFCGEGDCCCSASPMLRTQNKIDSTFLVTLFAWRDLLFEVVAQSGLSELDALHKSGEKRFVLWVWTLGLTGRILGHSSCWVGQSKERLGRRRRTMQFSEMELFLMDVSAVQRLFLPTPLSLFPSKKQKKTNKKKTFCCFSYVHF